MNAETAALRKELAAARVLEAELRYELADLRLKLKDERTGMIEILWLLVPSLACAVGAGLGAEVGPGFAAVGSVFGLWVGVAAWGLGSCR